MKKHTNYPPTVETAIIEWQQFFSKELRSDGIGEKNASEATRHILGPLLFKHWLKNGCISGFPVDEHISDIMKTAIVFSLVDSGFLSMKTDENGKGFYWLTASGKRLRTSLMKEQDIKT